MFSIISGRTTSAFPLSVGTSLAFESAIVSNQPSIDPERVIPQKVNLNDYDEIWINISTLFRNLVGSLTKDDSQRVHPGELAVGLMNEIDIIKEIVKADTLDKVKVVFYVCEHRDLTKSKYPYALFRLDTTPKQHLYRSNHDKAIKEVLKQRSVIDSIRVFSGSEITSPNYRRIIIITHIALDLCSSKNFNEFDLLESHTGVLKKPHQFNTKYLDGKKYPMLPFNKGLLQVFGDSEHFRPYPIKTREMIIGLAEKYKWTPATTRDKIKYSLSTIPAAYDREILLSLV